MQAHLLWESKLLNLQSPDLWEQGALILPNSFVELMVGGPFLLFPPGDMLQDQAGYLSGKP